MARVHVETPRGNRVFHPGNEPTLAPETLWHILADINVASLPPPTRKIRAQDLVVLKDRRAGNRGKANAPRLLQFLADSAPAIFGS
jgi:hypothetical protein